MSPEELLGVWQLESRSNRYADGTLTPLQPPMSIGVLNYESSGHMSAQIFPVKRDAFDSPNPQKASQEEAQSAFHWSVAYFGTYEMVGDGKIVHRVEGSLFPNWEGTDMTRNFKLEGDRLHITTDLITAVNPPFVAELSWRRRRIK